MAKAKTRPTEKPHFKNEAEEAEWLSSGAGQDFLERKARESRKRGTIYAAERTPEVLALAAREGKGIKYEKDPAKLQRLIAQAQAKSETKMIALRLPVADLNAVKSLAAKNGIGYQVLLKEIIHDALVQAS